MMSFEISISLKLMVLFQEISGTFSRKREEPEYQVGQVPSDSNHEDASHNING